MQESRRPIHEKNRPPRLEVHVRRAGLQDPGNGHVTPVHSSRSTRSHAREPKAISTWSASHPVTDFDAPDEPSVVRPPARASTLLEGTESKSGAGADDGLAVALRELSHQLCTRMDRMEDSLARSFQNMLEAAFTQATDPTPRVSPHGVDHGGQCHDSAHVLQLEVPCCKLLDANQLSGTSSQDLDDASGEDTSRASSLRPPDYEEPSAAVAGFSFRCLRREESVSQQLSRQKSLPELSALTMQQDIMAMQGMRSTGGLEDGSAKLLQNPNSPFQRYIFQPTSRTVLLWSLIGPVMLFYDVLMVPLSAFPLPDHWLMEAISVGGTTYWTIDTLRGFITGYELPNNQVEMRPGRIAIHYMTTWFPLDMMTCAMDWVLYFTDSGDMFNKFWRMGRALQAWKLMHPSRLMRVVRMCKRITENSPMFHDIAVHTKLLMKMLNLIFCCVILCHYIACNWYHMGSGQIGTTTWVSAAGLEDTTDLQILYTTSFLWALAQSGFAETELYPTNANERIFTCLVGLLWMMVICVIINFFNHCMLQLREMDIDREKESMLITKYLAEHNVSQAVRLQVHRYFRVKFATYRPRVHEEEIKFFKDVPLSLQIQLHQELYMPILEVHPVFEFLKCISNRLLAMLCHIAMHEMHVWTNQVIFNEGMQATHVWHVLVGRCQYYSPSGEHRNNPLSGGDWVCEPALWMYWTCKGRLLASCSGEILGVDAEKFAGLLRNYKLSPKHLEYIQTFVRGVSEHFMGEDPQTDMWDIEEMRAVSARVSKDMDLPHRRAEL